MNKKGTIEDKLYLLFVVAFIVIVVGAISLLYTPIYDVLYGLNPSTQDALDNIDPTSVYNWIDGLCVIAYFAFNILICIILPLYVRHNPIYIGAIFLFSFIYTFASAIIINAISEFLAGLSVSYTGVNFVLDNFLLLEVVFILLMVIIMFFKYKSVGGGDIYVGE